MRTIDTKEFANILLAAEAIRFDYHTLVYPEVDITETDDGDEYRIYIAYEQSGDLYEYVWDDENIITIVITDDGHINVYVDEEKFRIDILNITKLK